MIDVIFQVGLSNAALSLVLAVIAAVVGLRTRNSHLTHLLWLLLLIKLMTPPMMSVHWSLFTAACTAVVALSGMHSPAISVVPQAALFSLAEPWLVSLWVTGAIFYLVWSLSRVMQFHRWLMRCSRPAGHRGSHLCTLTTVEALDRLCVTISTPNACGTAS